mmetsp:Transcript_44542/g.147654  ORF Transcript_44542/g.147654 Transcript_44542/m.147654 type:complete len:281 (-) Transcript_44542:237-1079(-)|eukprot:CAMPEP_0202753502 /NCGR_PEP_ID=MMETSP1388-20130828/13627_1 /ASSEMBLY_ACC=CAM_ASM_000864 /TAXON_ID=37098 /ORGANISM="Isochrysis sp, Strain CCMP1244" /LENGTH=280 /DNA_ID=CAMNT_0049421249 /DNA_START=56 /DNA_END=898 /DNA_ORIENTATION=+
MDPLCADVLEHLPTTPDGQLHPHHYFTKRRNAAGALLWDALVNERFNGLGSLLPEGNCTMLYVGANVDGFDGRVVRKRHRCFVHMLEPVPSFYALLARRFHREPGFALHNFGVGNRSTTMQLTGRTAGQGTSYQSAVAVSDPKDAQRRGSQLLRILALEETLRTLQLRRVDLLHLNCEGCEYELLSSLTARSALAQRFGVVQFGTHNYPGDGVRTIVPQYCAIRRALSRTHALQWGTPFVWERWTRRRECLAASDCGTSPSRRAGPGAHSSRARSKAATH